VSRPEEGVGCQTPFPTLGIGTRRSRWGSCRFTAARLPERLFAATLPQRALTEVVGATRSRPGECKWWTLTC